MLTCKTRHRTQQGQLNKACARLQLDGVPSMAATHLRKEGEEQHAAAPQLPGLDLQKVRRLERGEHPDLQAKGIGGSLQVTCGRWDHGPAGRLQHTKLASQEDSRRESGGLPATCRACLVPASRCSKGCTCRRDQQDGLSRRRPTCSVTWSPQVLVRAMSATYCR